MVLDIRSFWLVGAISAFGFGLLLHLARRTYPESLSGMLSYCGAASICLGAGWTILLAETSLGRFAFLVLSRTLFSLCLTLQYRAITRIKRQSTSVLWIAGPPALIAAVCSWFAYVQPNHTVLVILFSLIQIATMVLLVRSLLRSDDGCKAFIDVVAAGTYCLFIASTSVLLLVLIWSGHFSPSYNFNNTLSIYNSIVAVCVFAAVSSMFPLMVSERLTQELAIQAGRDPLTGLFNRRSFEGNASRVIASAARTGQPVSLLVIDIDHFKQVNDLHGHSAGDALLKAVADGLRSSLREEDFLCRWGGDEFCALLPRASRDQAQHVAERALRSIGGITLSNLGAEIGVEVSIGIVTDEEHVKTLTALVDLADHALYRAKLEGRNRIALAGAGDFAKAIESARL
jgi:diguanylate cyclase (GGDEF)-like protein